MLPPRVLVRIRPIKRDNESEDDTVSNVVSSGMASRESEFTKHLITFWDVAVFCSQKSKLDLFSSIVRLTCYE